MSNQPPQLTVFAVERRQSMGQSSALHLLRYVVYSLYPALVTPLGRPADLRLSLGSMSLPLDTRWRGLPQ